MATKETKGKKSGFNAPTIGVVVPEGYVKRTNKDGTIEFVPKKTPKTNK